MQLGLSTSDRAWLRDWSARYVRGAGVLPTLLVGAQPYGLLPVSRIDAPSAPTGRVEHVEQMLGSWATGLDVVRELPRLDPEVRRRGARRGELAALVSKVLGSVPT